MEFGIGCCCVQKCVKKWTPRDDVDRTITIDGCAVTLLNNPFMEMIGADIAIRLDGLPSGPIPMGGGAPYFGPGSGIGIGYYGVNNQAVRLQRYCQWGPQLNALRLFDNVAGQTFAYDDSGFSLLGNGTNYPIAANEFDFADLSVAPGCIWSRAVMNLKAREEILIGETTVNNTQFSISYNNSMYKYDDFYVDRIQRVDVTGGSVYVWYNSQMGHAPSRILEVPRSELVGVGYPVLHSIDVKTQASGIPVDSDYQVSDGIGDYTDFLVRPYEKPGTTGLYTGVKTLEMGRTAKSRFLIESHIDFADGQFLVYPTLRFECNAVERHQLYNGFKIAQSHSVSDTVTYPISDPILGTPFLMGMDMSQWSNNDPTKGVYAYFSKSGPAIANGEIVQIDRVARRLLPRIPGANWWDGSALLPGYLGTETVTYSMQAKRSTVSDAGVYNMLTGVASGNGSGYSAEISTQFRQSADPVDIALEPDGQSAEYALWTGFSWGVIDGWGMAVLPGTNTLQIKAASDPAATLHRELI